ncbi:MAG: hypothetical protein M1822_007997 [Bathelium mastoideum]|nr:MAG: hypothetical protein M1822_007997 [Bathelium mastoideum]
MHRFTTGSYQRAENQTPRQNNGTGNDTDNVNSTPSGASRILSNLSRTLNDQKRPFDLVEASRQSAMYGSRDDNPNDPSSGGLNALKRLPEDSSDAVARAMQLAQANEHHLHVYATKHNTHLTLTNPARNPVLSLSAGNIGFRKAARGTYDAAYQLAAYTLRTLQEKGHLGKIKNLEVVLRGFGPGREAVTKVLLGTEGRLMRGKIRKVTDATRLKFGGTRSPKPRRLG